MMYLVCGGSASGKSEYAEKLAVKCAGRYPDVALIYVATMASRDEESLRRIAKHRKRRAGRHFVTSEVPENLSWECCVNTLADGASIPCDCTPVILIECMSNLVANEMFGPDKEVRDNVAERIISGIRDVASHARDTIIVTNNVHEDGVSYDPMTEQYIHVLGELNRRLAAMSDTAVEVVYGYPLTLVSPGGAS